MAWVDLEGELAELFGDVRLDRRNVEGFRFHRLEKSSDAVERVRRWRLKNRERRNAVARAAYARNRDERRARHREYLRVWRADTRALIN